MWDVTYSFPRGLRFFCFFSGCQTGVPPAQRRIRAQSFGTDTHLWLPPPPTCCSGWWSPPSASELTVCRSAPVPAPRLPSTRISSPACSQPLAFSEQVGTSVPGEHGRIIPPPQEMLIPLLQPAHSREELPRWWTVVLTVDPGPFAVQGGQGGQNRQRGR